MKIEGRPANCHGCYFKGYLLSTEAYCRQTGQKIKEITNCPSGPLVQRRPLLGYLKHLLTTDQEDTKAFWAGIGFKN